MGITIKIVIIFLSLICVGIISYAVIFSIYAYKNNKKVREYKLERKKDLKEICCIYNKYKDGKELDNKLKNFCKKYNYTYYDKSMYIGGDYNKDTIGHFCFKIYFYRKQKEKFGNKFDFSKMEYKDYLYTPIKIVCPIHGEFKKTPYLFLNSAHGCNKCSSVYTPTTKEFIKELRKVHGDKYDYSLVDYKDAHSKIKIICPIHGEFEQVAYYHLQGSGCPKCKNSKMETFTESILLEYNIKYEAQKKFDGCEGKSNYQLPFDFYLPDFNTTIECQGQQHYFPIEFFGGEKEFENQIKRDNIKREFCKDSGIKEIEIKYNQNPLTVLKENSIIN